MGCGDHERDTATCPNGHTYSYSVGSGSGGCPVCFSQDLARQREATLVAENAALRKQLASQQLQLEKQKTKTASSVGEAEDNES